MTDQFFPEMKNEGKNKLPEGKMEQRKQLIGLGGKISETLRIVSHLVHPKEESFCNKERFS